jgi:hypothetical protein
MIRQREDGRGVVDAPGRAAGRIALADQTLALLTDERARGDRAE